MAMFQLELADHGLVGEMQKHREWVEVAVEEAGLSKWVSQWGNKPDFKVGLVELLCEKSEWVVKRWLTHRIKGTKKEVREGQTPAKGEVPKMRLNTELVELLTHSNLVVRKVAEKMGVEAGQKPLTMDTPLPPGGYIYWITIKGDCPVDKGGHFQVKEVKGEEAFVSLREGRYNDRKKPPSLTPHAVGHWRPDNLELYALVSHASLDDEHRLHKLLNDEANNGGCYKRSPGNEMHDKALRTLWVQEMGKLGTLNVANQPPYSLFTWERSLGGESEGAEEVEEAEEPEEPGEAREVEETSTQAWVLNTFEYL
jgi:hypothetical protein